MTFPLRAVVGVATAITLAGVSAAQASTPTSAGYTVQEIAALSPYSTCEAGAANSRGDVAVVCDHTPMVVRGDVVTALSMTPHASQQGTAGLVRAHLKDINERGEVAGYVVPDNNVPVWTPIPARWNTAQELQFTRASDPDILLGRAYENIRLNNAGDVLLGEGSCRASGTEQEGEVCVWKASPSDQHHISVAGAPGADFPHPPGPATAFSDAGSIVGGASRVSYRWEPTGSLRTLGVSDSEQMRSRATDISANGTYVTGLGVLSRGGKARPYLVKDAGKPHALPAIGGESEWEPLRVSDDGVVVHSHALVRVSEYGTSVDDLSRPAGLREGETVEAINVMADGRVVANLRAADDQTRVVYLVPEQP